MFLVAKVLCANVHYLLFLLPGETHQLCKQSLVHVLAILCGVVVLDSDYQTEHCYPGSLLRSRPFFLKFLHTYIMRYTAVELLVSQAQPAVFKRDRGTGGTRHKNF